MRTFLLLLLLAIGTPADASTSPWRHADPIDGTPPLSARLIAPANGITADQRTFDAGLQFKLAPGWKTYWRSPGEVGLPPVINWENSIGIADVSLDFPAPKRFTAFEIENFGYDDATVLPLTIQRTADGSDTLLKLNANFLVCADICVPAFVDLNLMLPEIDAADLAINEEAARTLSLFQTKVPDDGRRSGIELTRVAVDPSGTRLEIAARARDAFDNPDIFPELGDNTPFGRPEIRVGDDRQTMTATIALTKGQAHIGTPIAITIVDGARASTLNGTLAAENASSQATASFALILVFALLGGLILNVMPCVLPVLSLKLASVIGHGAADLRQIRISFLATAAGIITAMLAIGAALIALKLTGSAIGWGIQFQNPSFLIFMILVITLFAANLAGLFEINLPSGLATRLSLAGNQGGNSITGDFLTGAFATLLATPCSAPFLGTAVSFALSGSITDIVLVFLMLGIGLAAPYFLIAARPAWMRLLPKPGNWMNWVKYALAAALAVTALWLLAVLATVESYEVSTILAGAMVLLVVTAALLRWLTNNHLRRLAYMACLALVALSFWTPSAVALFNPAPGQASQSATATNWTAFDQPAINALIADDKIVFVDVTADWCITCKANKLLVLDVGEVADRLQQSDIVPMMADWTKPDDAIAAYLQSHGRFGIPFNIVYGPAAPNGIALPELLTSEAVLEALENARGPNTPSS